MKRIAIVFLALLIGTAMSAQNKKNVEGNVAPVATLEEALIKPQNKYIPTEENLQHREIFNDYRFGIFIHWGLYSMFGQGEWYQNRGTTAKEYSYAAGGFYPSNFNAREWVKAFKNAGAKYICFTSRHCDSFSMWHTKQSEYNVVDATPFKRDVLKELADACEAEGISLHIYYSLMDWYREDYPLGITGHRTGRDTSKADFDSYFNFMKAQMTELLTNYGKIGGFWFDGAWEQRGTKPFDWRFEEFYSHIHSLQPTTLIINNHHLKPFEGEDAQTFESDVPGRNTTGHASEDKIGKLPLESARRMNDSWGYVSTDQNYKSHETLVKMLVEAASQGTNLLLNVGPRADGSIPETALERLAGIGKWLETYGESIYGTDKTYIPKQDWGYTTGNGKKIYMHVVEDLGDNLVLQMPLEEKVRSVKVFKDGTPLKYTAKKGMLTVNLTEKPSDVDYVITVELK